MGGARRRLVVSGGLRLIPADNVEFFFELMWPRHNKSYGYGGVWRPGNVEATTDCSGIVTHVLDAFIYGRDGFHWSRQEPRTKEWLSTESYRVIPVGGRGPFGTICVGRPQDIPADAAVRIGCQHGGGGRYSHMACTIYTPQGVFNVESSGSYGQQIGGKARGYNHSMFHDWHYLPGPVEDGDWGAVWNEILGIA